MLRCIKTSLIIIAVLILSFISSVSFSEEKISLIKITGKVEISPDMKSWKTVTKAQKIENKTWIKTGKDGSVVLVLPDRTQTKVTRNSTLFLEKKPKQNQTINLKLGKIWSKTNKIPVKIKLRSPNAVASIRGTEWVSEVKSDGTSVIALLEGEVSINSDAGNSININAGSVANIDKKGLISSTKIINSGKYLQFLYNYEIEPYAYIPDKELKYFIEINKQKEINDINEIGRGEFKVINSKLPKQVKEALKNIGNKDTSPLINFNEGIKLKGEWGSWFKYIKAEALIISGNISEYEKYIKEIPNDNRKKYLEAKYNISQGELEKAKKLLLSINPKNIMSFHNFQLGKIHKAMGLEEEAEKYFKASKDQAKLWVSPIIELASIAMLSSRFDYANELLLEAKELGNKLNSHNSIAVQFFTLRNQITQASNILSNLNKDDLNFSNITDAGVIELKKGNPSEAINKLVEATAIERGYSRAYSFLAVAHFQKGETKEAIRQLNRSIEFDALDPMPHIIASAIYSSELKFTNSIAEAKLAKKKSNNKTNLILLETDQQGTVNIGSRYLDVGLPKLAENAANQIRDYRWAGSYFYDAKLTESSYVRNSKYLTGYMMDSQVFGARRDKPDIISKPGNYSYSEYKASGAGEYQNYSIKKGYNGREILGELEKSYLFDFGAFGAVRDAYYPADDIDKSGAGLGFFGLGIRDNYDTNYFLTGNIVPFHTGGTYPIDDKTARFDLGASKRKDNETQMVRVGVEKGKSSVGSLVSGGCRGDDDQDTQKIEIGLSKVGKHESGFDYLLALEGGVKRGEMTYTAVHPTSGNCTDLTSMGNYSTRTDNVQSVESDYVASAMIKKNIYGGKGTIKVRLGNYQHDFDQSLILDNVSKPSFLSNANYFRFRPSLGFEGKLLGGDFSLANISDMKMVSSASFSATDIASIYPKFEFMNSGGKIEQNSFKYHKALSNGLSLSFEHDDFEIFNNPIKQIIREQWNSDLLENFTLKNYENPNLTKVVEAHDDFVAGKFQMTEIILEREFLDGFSMSFGFGKMDANELDHPYYIEASALGRVKLIPETYYYSGITFPYLGGIISGKLSKQENLVITSGANESNTSKYTVNFAKKIIDDNSMFSLNIEGAIEGYSTHKIGFTYRKMY